MNKIFNLKKALLTAVVKSWLKANTTNGLFTKNLVTPKRKQLS